jgi:hypothetical protein
MCRDKNQFELNRWTRAEIGFDGIVLLLVNGSLKRFRIVYFILPL